MLQNCSFANCVAIIDIKSDNIPHHLPYFDSLQSFQNSKIDFDIAYISTPNYLHVEYAFAILNIDKHVLIEKPMGLNSNDCQSLINYSNTRKSKIFCVMQNRFSPPAQWLKKILEERVMGNINYVEINCIWNRSPLYYSQSDWKGKLEKDGGTLYTQFSHFVDTMYWMFGDININHSKFHTIDTNKNIEFEDTGLIQFDFMHEGSGHMFYSSSAFQANIESSLTVLADKGSVKIGGQYMNQVMHCEIEHYTMPELKTTSAPNQYGFYSGSAFNHAAVVENIYKHLNYNEKLITTATEGMKVVEIIERIYAAR